ncbi:hypothetical protein PHYBOEH_006188 [Phytophthora boehmeriae]|uniref:Uncharacterized protein n=1 Tax=Phytophthora boehmeriae TaxID=109152 RepID=A0A8T1WIJ5_9STRA|nr:hypothetical protein PHYBOEH_006188 [Phytophthora boehmeriae]
MTARARWIAGVFATTVLLAVLIDALNDLEDTAELTPTHRGLQTSLGDEPSLNLHVTLKRKSMAIHGQSEFDVFAKPVVSNDKDKVLYDGYATFVEDDAQFKYILSGGAFYVVENPVKDSSKQTVRCLSAMMPFDSILLALNAATRIPSVSIGGETVESSGDLFKTSFGRASFALCASSITPSKYRR